MVEFKKTNKIVMEKREFFKKQLKELALKAFILGAATFIVMYMLHLS